MSDSRKIKRLVVATNNAHKLSELRKIVDGRIELLSMSELGCHDDIPETADTLEGNAMLKAGYIYERYGIPCMADDTGLEVDALDGRPGVYSARYAGGEGHDSQANMRKLLAELDGVSDRRARFRTVIALVSGTDEHHLFEGVVEGSIAVTPVGREGFGYDPVFLPDEACGLSFAQMDAEAKNAISHRGRATRKLMDWLLND